MEINLDDYKQETKNIFDYLVETNQICCVPCWCIGSLNNDEERKLRTITTISPEYPQDIIYIFCKTCGYTLSSFNREIARKRMESNANRMGITVNG